MRVLRVKNRKIGPTCARGPGMKDERRPICEVVAESIER
ncbi:transcriptional regulator GlcC, partial [Escherichia coli]|nr:transcriptional regulator GlcC [Escherichia coli]EFI3876104.1 transcriptional regulator GlcC [Escherichia coli]EFI4326554.1 transcriptional regulator GlcC [Escherichia coli]EFI8068878.1 transcriptional regulator GlcC [Escherichia coli]EFI9965154.1 transcriptional regulator GlcC [Escherichia coli]